jgi:hypothetical protein
MTTIAKARSGIIRRQMKSMSRRLFSLTGVLALCLAATVSAGTSFAQRKKPQAKPPAPTGSVRSKNPARAVKTPAAPEPEIQLERLPSDPSVENADISITAHLKARSLKFETVPNPTVEFPGQPARDTVWEAQRENLPTPVEPGVTYRNIGIRLKITSVFRDIDRIVAEALGEVPVTEDANPTQVQAKSSTEATATKPPTSPTAASPNAQPASTRPPLKERP